MINDQATVIAFNTNNTVIDIVSVSGVASGDAKEQDYEKKYTRNQMQYLGRFENPRVGHIKEQVTK